MKTQCIWLVCYWLLIVYGARGQGSPPVIADQPQDVIVNQGSTATFSVAANGSPPLSYQWRFNETNIIQGGTNSLLSIQSAQGTNQGGYAVIITNAFGSVTSRLAYLTVLLRPVITIHPQSQTVPLGADATFSASVTNNSALPLTYRWRKGSTFITNITLNEYTGRFTIRDVRTNDAGDYRVVVTNVAGSTPLSSSAVLTVTFPVVAAGFSLTAEDCSPNNGVIDPGERVTVEVALRNTNAPGTTNLIATLLEEPGIRSTSAPQTYEGLILNGSAVARTFSFTADGLCGATNRARLQLMDGTNNLGRVAFAFRLGVGNSNEVTCCFQPGASDLSLTITDTPDPVHSGKQLTYTVSCTNRGPNTAAGVTISNVLPANVTLLSAAASQGSCSTSGNVILCSLGVLNSGGAASATIVVRPTVPGGGMLVNTASVWAEGSDYNLQNNTATAVTTVRPPLLVPPGAAWKYLDNGSDQGTAWRQLNFDDASWLSGPAPLGYDESNFLSHATTVRFGPDRTNKYVTTYFRHAFDVTDTTSVTNLAVRLARDDGGIVYLNETEIFRLGMPAGPIAYDTWAAVVADAANETTLFSKALPLSLLRAGRNVVAVEVHQQRGTSSDIYFDLELAANSPFGNLPPVVSLLSPHQNAIFSAPTNMTFVATASDADGAISRVEFLTGSRLIATVTNSPYTFIWSNPPPGLHSINTLAIDNGGATSAVDVVGISVSTLVITSFAPASGPPGTAVTIQGANFSADPGSNAVFLGGVRADVTAATPTALTILVPSGVTYAPLTVTATGRTASARVPFVQTFDSSLGLDAFSFASGLRLDSGRSPVVAVVHDLDGDGWPDIAVANQNENTVSVYRNTASSNVLSVASFAPRVSFPTGLTPFGLAVADLDADGRAEIVVANGAANTVSVFGNITAAGTITSGSFAPKVDFPVAGAPRGVAIGDIDGDGWFDVAVASATTRSISVLRNLGRGPGIFTNTFAPRVEFLAAPELQGLVLADFDGDGKLDTVGGISAGSPDNPVFRNTSTPGVISSNSFSSYFPLGLYFTQWITAGDLDCDGVPDLVPGENLVPPGGAFQRVLRSAAYPGSLTDQWFEALVRIPTTLTPNSPTVGDLDGDGRPEIVSCIRGAGTIAIARNQSVPGRLTIDSFAPHFYLPVGTFPSSIALGDLDGDSRPDIVVANRDSHDLTVFRNVIPFSDAFVEFPASSPIFLSGSGTAATYPSTIQVSGFSGLAKKVRISLVDLNHPRPDDLDVLLVGPQGQQVLLVSDTGGDFDLSRTTVAFDDGASALPDAAAIASGTYRPTDYEAADVFPDPAPAGPYGTSLSVFEGTDPNGTWSLYAVNDAGGSLGSVAGGWRLQILPQPPGLSISDARVVEGNSGTTNIVFTVQLPSASTNAVSVDYATGNDNATAGSDYLAKSGRLLFPPGTTNQTITIDVNGDLVSEVNERFVVTLSNPANAPISDRQGQGTIQDDDVPTAASLPFVEDFESGFFQPYWLVSGVRNFVTVITNDAPNGGFHVRMDVVIPSLNARNELTLAINAEGWTNVLLRFWARRFYDQPTGPPPSPFVDGADFDGVAVSVDGTTWYEARGLRDLATSYQEYFVPLDDVVAANGLYYNSSFRIRFNRFGHNTTGDDGFNFDDISIDGIRAGELHHFNWSSIPSPQLVQQEIPVTINAVDGGNHLVNEFAAPAQLSALTPAAGTSYAIVGEPLETIFNNEGAFTFGFAITPNTNLFVTHARHYSGNKVSIWGGDGGLLVSQAVTSTGNSWSETPLSAPVMLVAGNRYVIGFYSAGATYHGTDLMATNFAHGAIERGQLFRRGEDGFPTTFDSAQRYFVDILYGVAADSLGITPATSGNFVDGAWTGNIAIQQPAANVFLLADDGAGHRGVANRISVIAPEDLLLSAFAFPNPVTVTSNLTYWVTVSNAGPASSSGVLLSNSFPAGLAFVSADTSQGICSYSAGTLSCHLGTLGNGATATVALTARAEAAGVVTNTVSVRRNEPESYLANNTVQIVTTVLLPSLTIDDISVSEADAEALFTIRLSAAGAQTVTVDYVTADDTAAADADYRSSSGTLTFVPGVTVRTLPLAILGDALDEPDETFLMRLTNATGATIDKPEGVGTIRDNEPPVNDNFADRLALSGTNVMTQGSNADATKETNELAHAGNPGGSSLWWSWTPPAAGFVTIGTVGSDFDTVLAVYTGNTLSELTLVAADDNSGGHQAGQVTFETAAGVTCQIAVDGLNGETGNILLAVVLSPNPPFSPSARNRSDFWSVDGTVNALMVTNGVIYVGGSFDYASPAGTKVVAYDTYTAEVDTDFPQILSEGQQVILPDGQGGWFIGGHFAVAGTPGHTNLVHILNDNTIDSNFKPDPNNVVSALALAGDILYVGGNFARIGGASRQRLAAIHLPTGTVLPWAPQANGQVLDMAILSTTIYIGGSFTHLGGQSRNFLAAVDATSGQLKTWNPDPDGAEAVIRTLGVRDNRVFVGGRFDFIGNAKRTRRGGLAALDAITGEPTDFYPDCFVDVLRIVCDTVFIGGDFASADNVPRSRIAALDINTGTPLAHWNPGVEPVYSEDNRIANIRSLAVVGNTLYVGGRFRKVGGQERTDLAALDITTGQVLAWNPNPNGGVMALAASGNKVLVGFESAPGGAQRRNLAAFDALTGKLTDWNPGTDDTVWALTASGNLVLAGGEFLTVGGLPRTMLAAIDATTGLVTGWNPSPNFGFSVYSLTISSNLLYAGGTFSTIDGQERKNLAAVHLSTGDATFWKPDPNNTVYTLAADDGTIYAGGAFTTNGSLPRNRLAAIDPYGQATAWDPDASARVQVMTAAGDTIYAGGDFNSVSNQTRQRLAVIDAFSGQATPWNASANSSVLALLVDGDIVYAGGEFELINGMPRHGLAALSRSAGVLLDWHPASSSITNSCFAMALSGNTLYTGGDFSLRESASRVRLAAFPGVGAPEISLPPANPKIPESQDITLSVAATGQQPFSYQWRFNGTNIPNATNATLVIPNAQASDSGTYLVIVQNALGAITAEAKVTVLVPVSITQQPSSQTVSPGTDITLAVGATGNPPPSYQWRLNGVNIPGAVYSTYTISNAQPRDGGSYNVVVANGVSAVSSDIATVLVTSPALPFTNNLAELALMLTGTSGLGSGNNVGADKEEGETNHVGKVGGASVWLRWLAPDDGVAIFNTRGSSFDTLLAIYTLNSQLSTLNPVAADEDRGGFATSQAAFNAVAGTEYFIAIDGLGGASGNIVLSWSLDTATTESPRILIHPLSQSVAAGVTVILEVDAASLTPLTYQWFKDCQHIQGATNRTLTLAAVNFIDVGSYSVFVRNDSSHAAQSFDALLEIGPVIDIVSQDKLEDLAGGGGGSGGGVFLVSLGTIESQTVNNTTATTSLRETNHCGVLGGASKWLAFRFTHDGRVQVDTIGSGIDTVLAVYRGSSVLDIREIACDDDSAPDGIRSLLQFNGREDTDYLFAVDGVNGAKGTISLNWIFGRPPTNYPSPYRNVTVRVGGTLVLSNSAFSYTPDVSYQWRLNGANLIGQSAPTLRIANLGAAHAGTYSLVSRNFAGAFTSEVAIVQVALPIRITSGSDGLRFQLLGPSSQGYAIEASSNLLWWDIVFTNNAPAPAPINWFDNQSPEFRRRFYRVTPWP